MGTCHSRPGLGFSCDCVLGYEGLRCEKNRDECAQNPCKNGGECDDGINSFTCYCHAGFAGKKIDGW